MVDILFIYEQFIGSLPDTYLKFASEWKKKFKKIFDTKVIASNVDVGQSSVKTSLNHLYEICLTKKRFSNN